MSDTTERQLNEATAQYGRSLDELITERDEAIEQRDRLAEACRMLMKIVGPLENPAWATDDQIDAAYNAAEQALAALNQPEQPLPNT